MAERVTFTPDAARRIGKATRYVEDRVMHRDESPRSNARHISGSGQSPGFWALLVDSGPPPGNLPDYTDSRYWFRRVVIEDTGTPPLTFRVPQGEEIETLELWDTAYHLTEWNTGPGGHGRHVLLNESVANVESPPRLVMINAYQITVAQEEGPTIWYGFTTHPGQMYDGYGYITSCIDTVDGCPTGQWVSITGPGVNGTDVPPDC